MPHSLLSLNIDNQAGGSKSISDILTVLSSQVFPIISGVVWLATLLGLLIYWNVDAGRVHYSTMTEDQSIAYISDIAADYLKPLFITGCVITTIFLDLSFGSDR